MGIIQKKYGHTEAKKKLALPKPAMYFIWDASSKPTYFSLYYNDHVIPLGVGSHTQLLS